jgi:hypothetical protein
MDRIPPTAARKPDDVGAALAALIERLVDGRIDVRLRAQADDDRWVDVAAELPSRKRELYRACRAGEIEGAAKIDRRWVARRSRFDAWIESHAAQVEQPTTEDNVSSLESMRSRLGLRRVV